MPSQGLTSYSNRPPARTVPENPFSRLHRQIDRLFEDFTPQLFAPDRAEADTAFAPSLDISETDDALEITADLPGLEEKDISLSLRDDLLILSGERSVSEETRKKNLYRAERAYGAFSRTIRLPYPVDEDKVEAKFKNGVLTVQLPKSGDAKSRERKIKIKAA